MNKSILYLTDNSIDQRILTRCAELLQQVSCGLPIVSVSQEPIDLGHNICVGKIGRSGMSIDSQILIGLDAIKTKWVMVAEHDCVYSEEHVRHIPPDDTLFWYNVNQWFAQYYHPRNPELKGMYSYLKDRFAMSQLVCDTELFKESAALRLSIISAGGWKRKYPMGRIGEPGVAHAEKVRSLLSRIRGGYPENEMIALNEKLEKYLTKYKAKGFKTTVPNLDLRHSDNFTGQRRGKRRTYSLEPWGRLEDVMGTLP
jgi:hypothetical protein